MYAVAAVMQAIFCYLSRRNTLFGVGLVVFAAMAVLGWLKLPYGVSLADEGMYVADAWRLTVGDRLFPDAQTGVLRLFALINAGIFTLNPDITLLGMRQIQFVLTLMAAAGLGLAVWRFSGRYWPFPWLLAPFAFTGMDPVGKVSSLSYYHYPHLFLVGHVALLLFALTAGGAMRRIYLLGAGVCLWGIGFALLPLSVSAVAPALVWLVARRLGGGSDHLRFSFTDLCWVLAPVALLWGAVFAIYGTAFFDALADMLRYAGQGGKTQAHVDVDGLWHMAIMAVVIGMGVVLRWLPGRTAGVGALALGGTVWWGMASGFGGVIAAYWRGWFAAPMWFCGFLMAGLAGYGLWLLGRVVTPQKLSRDGWLVLVLLLPAGVLVAVFGYFSEIGFLTSAYGGMPAWLGLGLLLMTALSGHGRGIRAVALAALVVPFGWQLAWADWRFTLFDLSPKYLTATIEDGFLRGIRTNPAFYQLDGWLRDRAERFSAPDDFAISLERTPMVHMQIRRRPALNHSWVGLMRSSLLRYEAMQQMRDAGRQPTIAFRFVQPPMFYPTDLNAERFALAPRATFYANHSISNHLTQSMRLVDTFKVGGQVWVECYVRAPMGQP